MKRRPDSHLQKRASKVSEFLSGFPLLLQSHQKISFLFFGNTRVSKLPRCLARLIKPEVDAILQLFDEFFQGKWLVAGGWTVLNDTDSNTPTDNKQSATSRN